MVVVSGSWMKNAPTYPTSVTINSSSNNGDVVATTYQSNENTTMAAKAILSCRPNSHPFQERTLILDQPIKVGRSVARAKPTSTNAIFDCKVLSRHHALLWYESGKFFLQDTKSSNGTFVNNNKLTPETENHELSSGDILQFGVDVVENNRQFTHGCIIATIRLYLPDGKEAKASPSITNEDRHGMVPLDDLYRLNQIIQEANKREQCLETKLTALQQVVEETRKSSEESWQALVREERLLSRISALQKKLSQANKNWSEDKLREELANIQKYNEGYIEFAKELMERTYKQKIDAVALAMEQERARITAEQEALLAKEQLIQAQIELETLAHKLSQHLTDAEEQRIRMVQREQELEANLESESGKLLDLQLKLHELKSLSIQDFISLGLLGGVHNNTEEKRIYHDDDVQCKEDMIAENDAISEAVLINKSNGIDNHINLMVGPVNDVDNNVSNDLVCEKCKEDDEEDENKEKKQQDVDDGVGNVTTTNATGCEERRRVYFNLPDENNDEEEDKDEDDSESHEGSDTTVDYNDDYNNMIMIIDNDSNKEKQQKNDTNNDIIGEGREDKDDNKIIDYVDSKTLKYQYQSAQNELKKKIELLESRSETNKLKIQELDRALNDEQKLSVQRQQECDQLKEELILMQQKYKEICNENQQYKDRMEILKTELELAQHNKQIVDNNKKLKDADDGEKGEIGNEKTTTINTKNTNKNQFITYDQLVTMEEELVLIKERYAQVNMEKSQLQRNLLILQEQYNNICNRSYNRYFLYVAPLVMMVIYLLISAMIS